MSYRLLWFISNSVTLFIILGTVLFELLFFELLWYLDLESDQTKGVGFFIAFNVLVISALWIRWSVFFKKWSLRKVIPEEKHLLLAKINDEKNSILINSWGEISGYWKVIRVLALTAIFGFGIYIDYVGNSRKRELADNHHYSIASIIQTKQKAAGNQGAILSWFSFPTPDSLVYDSTKITSGFKMNSAEANGFKIKSGDSFSIKYNPTNPRNNKLDFMKPQPGTLRRYKLEALEVLTSTGNDINHCNCIIDSVYHKFGVKGLGILRNHKTSYWENDKFNHWKYRIFTKNEKFKAILNKCNL